MVKRRLAAAAVAAIVLGPVPALAQTVFPPPDTQAAGQADFAPAALDQLLAPVALYPDALLAQILAASTYPLEVVQAHRWISAPQNAGLSDGALSDAVAAQSWDPSVQVLIAFPQTLQLLDEHLNWTEQLGEAFLAKPDDVMSAVQRLRHRAEQAGTLKISAQQSVVNEGDDIAIASPDEQDVYLPAYDPQCAYGPWPYPVTGPVDFSPWSQACPTSAAVLSYDNATYLPFGFFLWASLDWRHHCIHIDRERFALAQPGRDLDGDVWRHDPAHRRGAGYTARANLQRYGGGARAEAWAAHRDGAPAGEQDAVRRVSDIRTAVPRLHEGFAANRPGMAMPAHEAAHFGAPAAAMAGHGLTAPR